MLNPGQFERRAGAAGGAALLCAVLFVAVLGYWQVWRTDLGERAGNPRLLSAYHDPNRGRILDRDGNELAVSLPDGTRYYGDASVAHAVGYLSARYGAQGAELAFNNELTGEARESWRAAIDTELRRTSAPGLDVRLSLSARVQAAAARALGARTGAVVALDPRNGEVIAMVSVPTYDPGALGAQGESLLDDESSPLLNRVTQGLYPPGSTFKTVTAASALEYNVIEPTTSVTCDGEVVIDGFPISCSNVAQGPGTYPFRDAFTFSVNAVFARVGVDIGWPRLIETASRFGFGSHPDFVLETAAAQVVPDDSARTKTLLAETAFGQGRILTTPLQMAMVAATVANGGVQQKPILGLEALAGGKPVRTLETPAGHRVIPAEVAADLRDFMVAVVDRGQASGVAIPGVKVAGKTGTAETGRGTSHAWFIAFAPAEAPTIAVAVIVEDGGRGGEVAAPIAGAVLRAALGR